MTSDPFAGLNLTALGGQMAQAWRTSIETWWKSLLGDRERLAELAKELSKLGGFGEKTSTADLGSILQALEGLESRIGEVEEQVKTLAQNMALLVEHIGKS